MFVLVRYGYIWRIYKKQAAPHSTKQEIESNDALWSLLVLLMSLGFGGLLIE
jgi:hypothetical protein